MRLGASTTNAVSKVNVLVSDESKLPCRAETPITEKALQIEKTFKLPSTKVIINLPQSIK